DGTVDPDLALGQDHGRAYQAGGAGGEGRAHLAVLVAEERLGPPYGAVPVLLDVDEPEQGLRTFRPERRRNQALDHFGSDHWTMGGGEGREHETVVVVKDEVRKSSGVAPSFGQEEVDRHPAGPGGEGAIEQRADLVRLLFGGERGVIARQGGVV